MTPPANEPPERPCAWLLSAYRADSHAAWADWLVETFDEFDWRRLELPGRHFAWRIRGNPLSWLDELADGAVPDLLVATSMVDLATIRGLHPRLAGVSTLLYFHENQFAYPASDAQTTSVEAQMVQLYSALAADRVRFNSRYNLESLVDGIDELLARLPDGVPGNIGARIERKSAVLPVPIRPIARSGARPSAPAAERDRRLIVWNHRWEHDRNPDLFAEAMLELARRGADFRLALLGPRPRKGPDARELLRRELPDRIRVDAMLPGPEYRNLLAGAGIAVSTSRHEFQGLALLEAASAGCIPLVPDDLCYPEIYPPEYRYPAGDREALVARLAEWLDGAAPGPVDVERWTATHLEPAWRNVLLDEEVRFQEEMGRSRDA